MFELIKRLLWPPKPEPGSFWVARGDNPFDLEYEVRRVRGSTVVFALRTLRLSKQPEQFCSLRIFHRDFVELPPDHASREERRAHLEKALWFLMTASHLWNEVGMARRGALYGSPAPFGQLFVVFASMHARHGNLSRAAIDGELRDRVGKLPGAVDVLDALSRRHDVNESPGLRRFLFEEIDALAGSK